MASVEDKSEDNSSTKYTERFEAGLTNSYESRQKAEKCRDYYDHKQWTAEEEASLKARKQAPIVVNRIQPKTDAVKGLVINQRTDPKAWPRTRKHEQASYAVTDALRYVNDNADFDYTEERAAENFTIEGVCAAIVEINPKNKEIEVNRIPWDRYYYDSHSVEYDFSDKKYDGIVLWMDLEDAQEMFPDSEEDLLAVVNNDMNSSETYDDKPFWVDKQRKRVKICQEYSLEKGKWYQVYYTENIILEKKLSPYVDEDGEPMNPIVSECAYIDREGNRYGPCWFWLDLQDEINHRRSKALHIMSQRQTKSRRGAIADVREMKRELGKPDGHVEYDGDDGDFQILQTNDMATAQFNLLEDAKADLDSISINAQLSGKRQNGDLSGKAIDSLQAGGMLEVAPLMSGLRHWRKRVFEHIWLRIRQFWREDKWIRVTDDYNTLRWVGLNQKITAGELLKEKAQDESLPPDERMAAQQALAMMVQTQDPRMNQIVETRNEIAETNVDIVLDLAPDTITVQNEQFQLLAQLANNRPEIPFSAILKLSQIREKDAILQDIEAAGQQGAEMQQQQAALESAEKQASIQNTQADTVVKQHKGTQAALENQLLLETPISSTNVSV